MALTIGNNDAVQTDIKTGHALKTAGLVKESKEREGQMAMDLIASATSAIQNLPAPTASSGNNINIKV